MNLPNKLTISRIFCTPLMVLLYLLPIPYGIGCFLALGVYIAACLTDLFDGKIARKYNLVTDFGKFGDQIADKFLTTTALVLVLFSGVASFWASVLILLVVVLRDILISGIRMLAAKSGTVIAADIFGKIKSFVLDVACMICVFYVGLRANFGASVDFFRVLGLVGLIAGTLLTLVSCVNYCINAKDVILDSLNDKNTAKAPKTAKTTIDADTVKQMIDSAIKDAKLAENNDKSASNDSAVADDKKKADN